METMKFEGRKYAIGLRWSSISGDKVAAEVASLSDELGMRYGVTRKIVADGSTRVQVGLSDEKSHTGLISAAAILAEIEEYAILVEDLGNDTYWICAVADNQVVAGSDVVIERSEINDAITEITNEFATITSHIKLCVNQEIASEIDVSVDEYLTFASLVDAARIKDAHKVFRKYAVKNLKGVPRSAILFCVFAGLCAGVAYYTINAQAEYESELERQRALEDTMAIVKKEPTQEELLQKGLEEEKGWFAAELSAINTPDMLADVYDFISKFEVSQAGWNAVSATYSSDSPENITISWEKTPAGTGLTLKSELKADSISFGLDDQKAVSTHKVINKQQRKITNPIEFLGSVKYNYQEMMHDMQMLGFSYQFAEVIPTNRPQPIEGIKDQILATTRQLHVKSKAFELSNTGLPKLTLAGSVLSRAQTSFVKNINIELGNGFAWKISGEIYEN